MKTKKASKKLAKLLLLSQEGQPGICSALFNKNDVILNGFSNVAITPDTALFYVERGKQLPIFHCIVNGKTHSNYSKDVLTVAINSQNNLSTEFYLHLDDSYAIFSNGLTLDEDLKIVLYFEYDNNSIFVIGFTDISSNRFIVECISSKNKSSMAFSRLIVEKLLENNISNRFSEILQPIFQDSGDLHEK
ncbi:hypothetical protein R6U76_18605 [Lysinibacillus capsici]|uniref:hypothetical protein n=1 Tax=Lysinibacillus TaxID=400634 RepID=UPI0025829AD8|nr:MULTISPECIES: hypothetical protein [Lysinibacillus]WPK04632.1 hypothetical protein R6U76_18605 [Lysinibacillus capsici]